MISTHFRHPHRPSERELRFVDLYARQAADMIERKRAEDALRASEERFRRYFELGLIGMAMTSPTKGILEVNDELCRILGYERYELLQKTWAEITHPDDLAADVAQFKRVVAGEIDGYSLDKRWIRKDGAVIDSIMSARCMRRADGSVEYFVGLVLDTTERRRAEEKLRRSEAYLTEAQRLSHTGIGRGMLPTGEIFSSQELLRISWAGGRAFDTNSRNIPGIDPPGGSAAHQAGFRRGDAQREHLGQLLWLKQRRTIHLF